MKRLLRNKPAVKQSLLFTTVFALSIWVGSNPNFIQHDSNHPFGGEGLILQQPTTRDSPEERLRQRFAADFL